MGKSGGGDPGGYGAASSNLLNQLAQMGGEQWGIMKPAAQNIAQMGVWQSGMARQAMPWLMQTYMNKYSGGPNVRYGALPGLGTESGAAVAPGGDAAAGFWQPAPGGGGTPAPGGGTPASTPTPTPTATPAAVEPYSVPDFNLPGEGPNVGTFDTSLYDLERGLWERSRTDIERQGNQAFGNPQQQLGQRFGLSGASPSLAAGAASNLQGAINESLINSRLGIAEGLQGQQQQYLQGLSGLTSGLMGLDSGPLTYGIMNANNALGNAAQGFGGLAQWRAQQQNSFWNSLAQLGQAAGMFV